LLEKEIATNRLADLRRALEQIFGAGASDRSGRCGATLVDGLRLLQNDDAEIVTLRWLTQELQEGEFEEYPTNAVYFLHHQDVPFVAHLFNRADDYARRYEEFGISRSTVEPGHHLQVLAANIDDATAAVEFILSQASRHSVYRGRMIHVESRGNAAGHRIRISDRPKIDDHRIILPTEVLEVLQRCTASRTRYGRLLERHGHRAKTGVLLHGPPGTGKTLVTKHLIGVSQEFTAIVPSGMDSETIREVFRLATYLQPALVVIEDVDLLASRRETNANVTGLQELMNEMDGLAPSAEAIVVMSTNRPEILEPALASRPGRVSQAILFPLPNAGFRNQLIRIFCGPADMAKVSVDHWVERTTGASPAFIEELVKKSIVFAALRNEPASSTEIVQLTDDDFDRAIYELVVFGGSLTGNILGFPTADSQAIQAK
jgi:SpoVK/Ycf46/Vps4 family AAA+-type ATPase